MLMYIPEKEIITCINTGYCDIFVIDILKVDI